MNGTEAKLGLNSAGGKVTVTFTLTAVTSDGEEEPPRGQKVEEQEPELTPTPDVQADVMTDGGEKALCWTVTVQNLRMDRKRRTRGTLSPSGK